MRQVRRATIGTVAACVPALGMNYQFTEEWSAGARLRTGDSRSQQSPHLTFVTDDGSRDELDFVADRYFVQYKSGPFLSWAGRNITPFWQQNELFWDEDVTPTGLAASYDVKAGPGTLTGTAGHSTCPTGVTISTVKWSRAR
jgi:hypothetical protein